jgi:thiamine pyrophosphokinase
LANAFYGKKRLTEERINIGRLMAIAIFCNGQKISKHIFSLYRNTIDYIICADGGVNKIIDFNIHPDAIIGDFDSITKKLLTKYKNCEIIHISDQHSTDLEKALNHAITFKPKNIYIFGAIGSRIDHTLTNLNMMKKFHKYSNIELISNKAKLIYINKPIKLQLPKYAIVSLFPIGLVKKVTLKGFKFPLTNEDLEFGVRDGQSNLTISDKQEIIFEQGELFVTITF